MPKKIDDAMMKGVSEGIRNAFVEKVKSEAEEAEPKRSKGNYIDAETMEMIHQIQKIQMDHGASMPKIRHIVKWAIKILLSMERKKYREER